MVWVVAYMRREDKVSSHPHGDNIWLFVKIKEKEKKQGGSDDMTQLALR